MSIIRAEHLGFNYVKYSDNNESEETVRAVENVDFEVEKGEFIAILGHNGSGKSTLAKHINALLIPSEGTMWVDGINTSEEEEQVDIAAVRADIAARKAEGARLEAVVEGFLKELGL